MIRTLAFVGALLFASAASAGNFVDQFDHAESGVARCSGTTVTSIPSGAWSGAGGERLWWCIADTNATKLRINTNAVSFVWDADTTGTGGTVTISVRKCSGKEPSQIDTDYCDELFVVTATGASSMGRLDRGVWLLVPSGTSTNGVFTVEADVE